MSFYGDLASTASRLLAQFGSAVTIKRETGDSIDPVTGAFTAGETSSLTTNGLTTAITKEDREAFGEAQGNDRILILDDSQAPQEGDRVQVGAEDWQIVRIQETNPAGTPLVYRVLIRK